MTRETHRARHIHLHDCADELGADYLLHHPNAQLDQVSFEAVLDWSGEQARFPTEPDPQNPNHQHNGVAFTTPRDEGGDGDSGDDSGNQGGDLSGP